MHQLRRFTKPSSENMAGRLDRHAPPVPPAHAASSSSPRDRDGGRWQARRLEVIGAGVSFGRTPAGRSSSPGSGTGKVATPRSTLDLETPVGPSFAPRRTAGAGRADERLLLQTSLVWMPARRRPRPSGMNSILRPAGRDKDCPSTKSSKWWPGRTCSTSVSGLRPHGLKGGRLCDRYVSGDGRTGSGPSCRGYYPDLTRSRDGQTKPGRRAVIENLVVRRRYARRLTRWPRPAQSSRMRDDNERRSRYCDRTERRAAGSTLRRRATSDPIRNDGKQPIYLAETNSPDSSRNLDASVASADRVLPDDRSPCAPIVESRTARSSHFRPHRSHLTSSPAALAGYSSLPVRTPRTSPPAATTTPGCDAYPLI